jgi:hypothetical protein
LRQLITPTTLLLEIFGQAFFEKGCSTIVASIDHANNDVFGQAFFLKRLAGKQFFEKACDHTYRVYGDKILKLKNITIGFSVKPFLKRVVAKPFQKKIAGLRWKKIRKYG